MGNGVGKVTGKIRRHIHKIEQDNLEKTKPKTPRNGGSVDGNHLKVNTTGSTMITVCEKPICTLTDSEKLLILSAWHSVDNKMSFAELVVKRIFLTDQNTKRVFKLEAVEDYDRHKRFTAAVQQLASFLDAVVKALSQANSHEASAIMAKCCRTFGSKHIRPLQDAADTADHAYWGSLTEASAEEIEILEKGDNEHFFETAGEMAHIKAVWTKFMNDLMLHITCAYVVAKERSRRLSGSDRDD